jgi:mRNA interferase MazF
MELVKMEVKRFEIWLVSLEPTKGSEITKTRPCLVISPDSANKYLKTVIVALLTHTKKSYPTRVDCLFDNQNGQIVLDQIRAIDKETRLIKKMGVLDPFSSEMVCKTLEALFKM